MKRASANMWWIIIGAVIALVVMIVLLVMFVGRTQPISSETSSCEGKGGFCSAVENNGIKQCPQNSLITSAFECSQGKHCCLGSPTTSTTGCPSNYEDKYKDGYCYKT